MKSYTTYLWKRSGGKFVGQKKAENRIKWITAAAVAAATAAAMVYLLKWRIISFCTKWQHCVFVCVLLALDTTISRSISLLSFVLTIFVMRTWMRLLLLITFFYFSARKKWRQTREWAKRRTKESTLVEKNNKTRQLLNKSTQTKNTLECSCSFLFISALFLVLTLFLYNWKICYVSPFALGINGFFRMSSREGDWGNQTFFRAKSSWIIWNGIFSNSMHMLGYIPSFHGLLQNDHNQFSNCAQLTSREKEYSNR